MTPKGFRLDIQGVRGFALILVLLTHAETPFLTGGFVGLDIFFVLSGFLITGLIVDEIRRTGTVSLLRFYGRRAKRLLPAAVTVLLFVLAGSVLLFDPVRGQAVSADVIAATLYFVNWRFMAERVDYFAFDDGAVSPVQHYWSLSVEEQFYLLWPALLLAAVVMAMRIRRPTRTLLWMAVAPIGIASFAYGVWFTGVDPQQSYFSTLGRVWELMLGAALALALPAGIRLPRPVSTLLAGGGLAFIVGAAFAFDETTPYPGWQALLPTMGTAAIIVAGTATRACAPIRLLCQAPLQYLGKISYSWYLWHWPVIVFAVAIWGPLPFESLLLVTGLAWFPAIVTHYRIEERFRRSRPLERQPRRALALGFACSLAALSIAVTAGTRQPTVPLAAASAVPGAAAIERGEVIQPEADALRPRPHEAREDRGQLYEDGCLVRGPVTESDDCAYGDSSADTTVVLLGDSRALQYGPTLRVLAHERGWRLVGLTRGGCAIADVEFRPNCDAWRENALRRIEEENPALVVVAAGTGDDRFRVIADGEELDRRASQPLLEEGFARLLGRIRGTGASVAVIRDQARAPFNVTGCVVEEVDALERCAFAPQRPTGHAFELIGAAEADGVRVIDPMPILCPGSRCPAVIGNAIVYRDSYHLTATFARTLAPWLERQLPDPEAGA